MSIADEALYIPAAGSRFIEARSFAWNLVSTRSTQFGYFDHLLGLPEWKGRKILDFGGNVGTFLVGAGSRVDHDDYWCLDLNQDVVEQGRRTFPGAHFVHYNRYSSQYNPYGVRYLPVPDCGVKFDIILAFSVFTHIDRSEMLELVGSLRSMLAPEGVLAFTFWDPHFDMSRADPTHPSVHQVRRNFHARADDEKIQRARWWVLINDDLYVEPGDELGHQTRTGEPLESYCAFFTADYMASLFPDATVHAPVSPEWQYCCIIKNTGSLSPATGSDESQI
jgi:SAM-dependent methyltransferase